MKIIDKTKNPAVWFVKLSVGDCCSYNGQYYLKIEDIATTQGSTHNAIRLNGSRQFSSCYFTADTSVIPIYTELVINGL